MLFPSSLLVNLALLAGPTEPCVGFEFVQTHDFERAYDGADGRPQRRPLEYGLWYPATACEGDALTRADYARAAAVQGGHPRDQPVDEAVLARLFLPDATAERAAGALRETVAARRGLPKPAKALPLVVQIHATALDAAPLAEALAARGFLVAAFSWRGARRQEFAADVADFWNEIEDAQFVAADVARRGVRDDGTRHAIGTSYGAMVALCWAGKDGAVSRVASLDGGIVSPFGGRLMRACPFLAPPFAKLELLNLYDASYAELTLEYPQSLVRSRVVDAPVPLLRHEDYSGMTLLRAAAGVPDDHAERAAAYRGLVERVVEFLARGPGLPEQDRSR